MAGGRNVENERREKLKITAVNWDEKTGFEGK